MEINMIQERALELAVQKMSGELGLSIYTTNTSILDKAPATYGVNWSAQGTKPAEEAKEYARNILKAAEIAEALTICEFETDYSEWPEIKDREAFKTHISAIYEALKTGSAVYISKAVEETVA